MKYKTFFLMECFINEYTSVMSRAYSKLVRTYLGYEI